MRAEATAERTLALLTELGRATSGARLYLTGGASAVLVGWRERTVDVDIRLDGDEDRLLRAISALKDRLDINIELAGPPRWTPNRSPPLTQRFRASHRARPMRGGPCQGRDFLVEGQRSMRRFTEPPGTADTVTVASPTANWWAGPCPPETPSATAASMPSRSSRAAAASSFSRPGAPPGEGTTRVVVPSSLASKVNGALIGG
jgi:hypothetical protein